MRQLLLRQQIDPVDALTVFFNVRHVPFVQLNVSSHFGAQVPLKKPQLLDVLWLSRLLFNDCHTLDQFSVVLDLWARSSQVVLSLQVLSERLIKKNARILPAFTLHKFFRF